MKKFFKGILIVVLALVVLVGGYVAYVLLDYHRIPDQTAVAPEQINDGMLTTKAIYTALSYNIGYGSYPPDYSFFMDGGKESVARSRQAVLDCIDGTIATITAQQPDLVLLQEVDLDATRSHHVDEYARICAALPTYSRAFAVNYDSSFLFYPFLQPIGKTLGGIATFAAAAMDSCVRRSLPISTDLSKLVDLDRCYTVTALPVDNGRTLYVYNVHMTAYGLSDDIRIQQMTMLANDMAEKMEQGDYILCGGDFNHDFTGNSRELLNADSQGELEWAQPLLKELLPEGVSPCVAYDENAVVPTVRNLNEAYEKGKSLTVILDGFLISDNIRCVSLQNLDLDFQYSDHNPVRLQFELEA